MSDNNSKLREDLKKHILSFMKKRHIGIGTSSFAMLLREIADYVDD